MLIATDVAARGLDIPEVDLVIQCEPPRVCIQSVGFLLNLCSIIVNIPGGKCARDLTGHPVQSWYSADSHTISFECVSFCVIARLQRTMQTKRCRTRCV